MLVAVVVQLSFVEQKEKDQTCQQSAKQRLRARLAFKSLRQQMHKRGGQQRACGQAEQVLGVARQHAVGERRGYPHTADTGYQRACQNHHNIHNTINLIAA